MFETFGSTKPRLFAAVLSSYTCGNRSWSKVYEFSGITMSNREKAKNYCSGDEINGGKEIKDFEEERISCSCKDIKDYREIK